MPEMEIPGRLRWRCRRGMLELDLVLAQFLQQHCLQLTARQLAEFDALLDLPDQSLWALLRDERVSTSAVISQLQACRGGYE